MGLYKNNYDKSKYILLIILIILNNQETRVMRKRAHIFNLHVHNQVTVSHSPGSATETTIVSTIPTSRVVLLSHAPRRILNVGT